MKKIYEQRCRYPVVATFIETGNVTDQDELREQVTQMYADFQNKSYDHLTGFLVRGEWHSALIDALERAYKDLSLLDMYSNHDAVRIMKSAAKALSQENLIIVYGDAGFVNLANKRNHTCGDDLIRLIVNRINQDLVVDLLQETVNGDMSADCIWGRFGGDEFVGFYQNHETLEINNALRIFTERLDACDVSEELPHFFEHDIHPCFNIGMASLKEALVLTIAIIENGLGGGERMSDILVDTFVKIADMRSQINKGLGHIHLVLSVTQSLLLGDIQRFSALIPFLLKGCIGIGRFRLGFFLLVKTFCSRHTFENMLLKYVLSRVRKNACGRMADELIAKTVIRPWQNKECKENT